MNRKIIITVVLCSLIILGIVLASLELTGTTHLFNGTQKKETAQEARTKVAEKQALADQGKPTTAVPSTDTTSKTGAVSSTSSVNTKDYSAPTSDKGITLTASQANPSEETITTKLTGYSDGTCNLTVSSNGKSTTQTAPVMFEKEFSTCAGFTVPTSSVGSGTWNVKLEVLSGGNTTAKTISTEVK